MAERKIFGTDGVRGTANLHPMTPEFALRLGRAIAYEAGKGKDRPVRVLIGKDTRLSGYMIETALASGICAMGGHVRRGCPCPSRSARFRCSDHSRSASPRPPSPS